MVSDVTFQTALQGQQETQTATATLAEDFSNFLQLLTVQLQNQDPLSPMETSEFTNQLVAFTGVEQQINTNQKLDDLVALELSNTFSTALDYVGLDVNYISSEFAFDGANANRIAYAFDGEPIESKITITDESGDIVYQTDGGTNSGSNEFFWDGLMDNGLQAPAGTYSVQIDALDSQGNGVDATTVVSGKVKGVESQNGQVVLIVGQRAVPLGSVINVNDDTTNKQSTALSNGLNYIGKEITYNSEIFHFDGTEPVEMSLSIGNGAAQGTLSIYDKNGILVYQDVGIADNAGTRGFLWNGQTESGDTADPGQYTVKITSTTEEGDPVETSASFVGVGQSVVSSGSSVAIEVNNTNIPLSNIVQVKVVEPDIVEDTPAEEGDGGDGEGEEA